MWHKTIIAIVFGSVCILAMPLTLATPLSSDDLALQRETFTRAEHALKKHDYTNYERLAKKITSYPLYPYLLYYELKQEIQHNSSNTHISDKIQQFQTNFPDFPFNLALRELWLTTLAKEKNWTQFIKYYQPQKNDELTCYFHLAQYDLTKETQHLHNTQHLWLMGSSAPLACEQLFLAWAKSTEPSQTLIWERFSLALQQSNYTLANDLIKLMTGFHKTAGQLWIKGAKNPELINSAEFLNALPNPVQAQILTNCLQRLAKQNPTAALNWWQAQQTYFSFSIGQKNAIERDIGVYLCHQRHPLAQKWLTELNEQALDNTAREWQIRLALLESDWQQVITLIKRLPKESKEDNCWKYWYARALESIGKQDEAKIHYQKLAATRNYYGFISSLRLKQPISIQHHLSPISATFLNNLSRLPAIQRFKELNLLKRHAVARVEWFKAVDKMNEKELIAAAKIAQKMNHPDLAILTMAKAEFKDDIPLRFPLTYQKEITTYANKHNIDPAWIFGVMRQESAFFNEAVSRAGARGLLQLLPSTAKTLAAKHEIDYVSEYCLHKPMINLQLGTAYLNNLKKQMNNHIILATASYNAGPTRTQKWLPQKSLEADIWIETIPYKETREYIKNVLAFTSIYRLQLGYPAALELMMKPIPATNSLN